MRSLIYTIGILLLLLVSHSNQLPISGQKDSSGDNSNDQNKNPSTVGVHPTPHSIPTNTEKLYAEIGLWKIDCERCIQYPIFRRALLWSSQVLASEKAFQVMDTIVKQQPSSIEEIHSYEDLFLETEKRPTRSSWPIIVFTDLSATEARANKPQITRSSVVEYYLYLSQHTFESYYLSEDGVSEKQMNEEQANAVIFQIGMTLIREFVYWKFTTDQHPDPLASATHFESELLGTTYTHQFNDKTHELIIKRRESSHTKSIVTPQQLAAIIQELDFIPEEWARKPRYGLPILGMVALSPNNYPGVASDISGPVIATTPCVSSSCPHCCVGFLCKDLELVLDMIPTPKSGSSSLLGKMSDMVKRKDRHNTTLVLEIRNVGTNFDSLKIPCGGSEKRAGAEPALSLGRNFPFTLHLYYPRVNGGAIEFEKTHRKQELDRAITESTEFECYLGPGKSVYFYSTMDEKSFLGVEKQVVYFLQAHYAGYTGCTSSSNNLFISLF